MRKYEQFSKALANLGEGVKLEPPYTPVEQTGIIGLFEICYELSWKLMKELLERHGRIPDKTASPRAILKLAYQHGMVSDEQGWIGILNMRNELIHTYNDDDSLDVIAMIKQDFFPLFCDLKRDIDERWLLPDD